MNHPGPRVIGLTGGIATGKSSVARILRELGLPVIDADTVARDVMAPGEPLLAELAEAFGSEVLTADGALDRAFLRHLISHDASARERLNALTHPVIRRELLGRVIAAADTQAQAGRSPVVFVEAALLVETGSYRNYSDLWVVTCNRHTQLERVMSRDQTSEADATALIEAQMPQDEKEAVATRVIRNDGDLQMLQRAVQAALSEDDLLSTSRG